MNALRHLFDSSPYTTELEHVQIQLRLVSSMMAFTMLMNLIDPATFILHAPGSMMYAVAAATEDPRSVAAVFLLAAACLVPYTLMQILCPECPSRRALTKLACFGLLGAAVHWFFLSFIARELGSSVISGTFTRTGLMAVGFAFTLGLNLNAELSRLKA